MSASPVVIGTGSIAQKGNILDALAANLDKYQSWIVDSGASDHMTGDKIIFHQFSAYGNSPHVRITDGTLSKVMGIGTVIASKNLIFQSLLYVPKLN